MTTQNNQIGQNKPNAEVNIFEIFKDILFKKCYPNVAIAFRIYLTIACGVCVGERSFSKLALIKNQKRFVMCQDQLSALRIICIEHDFVKELNYAELISKFAAAKARKVDI